MGRGGETPGLTEATKGKDRGRKEGGSGGREKGSAGRSGEARRYFRKSRRGAARRERGQTQETRNALSRTTANRRWCPTITWPTDRTWSSRSDGASEDARERSVNRQADRHAPRRRSGVGLPTSRHSPVPWTVLYLPLSMTLYTGPFRPLSVRRNTVFYQLLRRAPITGKL